MLIYSLASVVAELLAILWFFTKWKLKNISGTQAATWWQKLAADFPSFTHDPKFKSLDAAAADNRGQCYKTIPW